MPDLNRYHPAVEAARRALANDETNGCMIEQHEGNGMWTCFAHGVSADGPDMCWYVRDMPPIVLEAASEHYTADDLRGTPAGQALMAEGWETALAQLEMMKIICDWQGNSCAVENLRAAHERIMENAPYRKDDA